MIKISAIVLTKNEEKNIIDCLECLSIFDEVIVIDDNSKDRTIDLIEGYRKDNKSVKIYSRSLGDDFSAQRKFGIEKSKNDWVLFVDADERITKELAEEIVSSEEDEHSGFMVPRVDFMWGKRLNYGDAGKTVLLRLFNKNKGELKGKVHEVWQTKDKVGRLLNPLLHYPHPTVSEFLKEINFYSDLRAKELFNNGVRTNLFLIVLYPKAKFLINYFLRLGFLDGIEGLVHAVLMSFYSFLVRGKLWLLCQRKQAS